jgi:hypothetical protein
VGADSNDETKAGLVLNDASSYGTEAATKIRLLDTTTATSVMYLEIYIANTSTSPMTVDFIHEAGYGWELLTTPAAVTTIPSGYTAREKDIPGAFAVN